MGKTKTEYKIMGLRGEWWIDDTGYAQFADGDIGDQNHETIAFQSALGIDLDEVLSNQQYALERITEYLNETDISLSAVLGITPVELLNSLVTDINDILTGHLTETQILGLMALGADAKFLNFIRRGQGDVRTFMMLEHAWIRVDDNNFQLWTLDDDALGRIRDFVSNEYPEDEDPLEDEFEIEELRKGGVHLSVSGTDLLESGKSADALKYSAQRERTGMYNPPEMLTPNELSETLKDGIDAFHGGSLPDKLTKVKAFGGLHAGSESAARERMGRPSMRGKERSIAKITIQSKQPYMPGKILDERDEDDRTQLFFIQQLPSERAKLLDEGYDVVPYINAIEDPGSLSFLILDPSGYIREGDRYVLKVYNPDPSERTYYEIGHRGLKSKLWYGDEFNINVEDAVFDIDDKYDFRDPRNLHNEWALRMPWHGRYDPYSGEVSIMGGTMTEEWRQPSEQMLDRLRETFGADVKIVQFNNPPRHKYNPKELKRGIKVEKEHTDDPKIAKQIAMDHLNEDPHYYSRLLACGITHNPRRSGSLSVPVIHPGCDVQVIEDYRDAQGELHARWKTIASCLDTPKAIGDVFRKHGLQSAWIRDAIGGRRMVTMRELI
ncbi:MAG: hypothetical protein HQM05_15380 [Magnetococcales bacterium]|nr:hypothetical protein [Magnetococcales bacterium]